MSGLDRDGMSDQMRLAVRAMASHSAQAEAVDRTGWTRAQWVADAGRLMNHIDGSVMSLVNGHVLALLDVADAHDRLVTALRELADEWEHPSRPPVSGWQRQAARTLRALLAEHGKPS